MKKVQVRRDAFTSYLFVHIHDCCCFLALHGRVLNDQGYERSVPKRRFGQEWS